MATRKIYKKAVHTRTYKGTNVNMDHYLVFTNMRCLRDKKKYRIAQKTDKFDVDSLRNKEVKDLYENRITENNTLQATDLKTNGKE